MALDEHGQRTMFLGVIGGFVIYALSLAALYLLPEPIKVWVSIGLTIASMVFIVGWYLAVRGGWRIGSGPKRLEKRAKAKQAREKEKLRNLRMRR